MTVKKNDAFFFYHYKVHITMVKLCPNTYPKETTDATNIYAAHFAMFPFELSPFQKWSIQAIVEGNHALICAHTGSGKTLPAEFAIAHFCKTPRKRIIYCSPIKALSNQKYHDFQEHPLFVKAGITFGLITGDIKANPTADVLIMTTEILLNKLYGIKDTALAFDLDFADVACVIYDEVHYINDRDRGHVWEQSIMLLPSHIQLVMLSATLESPETFACWIEGRYPDTREVYLTVTTERIVPLIHYSYITCTTALFKQYGKDKEIETRIRAIIDTPHPIKYADGTFCENVVDKIKATLQMFDDKNYAPSRQFVMNQVCKYLGENEMFPAICFVYSRKQVEDMARELETVVLEDDSKVRYMVHKECEAILRSTLPNWAEYTTLPEYQFILSLLEKGVAIHHAGLLSIFREMIEIIFARGYIKILFATETFSVGINMPTKTVLFTSLTKFDGATVRALLPHEYNQQSGRAGRRGKDTIGHVIHLTNLWGTTTHTNQELRHILTGSPQSLESKFHISYSLILYHLAATTDLHNLVEFANKSMLQQQISNNEIGEITRKLHAAITACNAANDIYIQTPELLLQEWTTLTTPPTPRTDGGIQFALSGKQQKTNAKRFTTIKDIAAKHGYPIDTDVVKYHNRETAKATLGIIEARYKAITEYSITQIRATHTLLTQMGFVACIGIHGSPIGLTTKGNIARFIREMHCIAFTEWFYMPDGYGYGYSHRMQKWTAQQIVQFLSMFTAINASGSTDDTMGNVAMEAIYPPAVQYGHILDKVSAMELELHIQPGADKAYHVALVDIMPTWCNASIEAECKVVMQQLANKGILLGEFVKAVLKIVNLAAELEAVAEYLGDLAFLEELRKIPALVLKFVCTNQSLYI